MDVTLFICAVYGIIGGYLGAKHTQKYPWQVSIHVFIIWIYGWPIMIIKGE